MTSALAVPRTHLTVLSAVAGVIAVSVIVPVLLAGDVSLIRLLVFAAPVLAGASILLAGRGTFVGFVLGAYLIGRHLIGWTVPSPGLLLQVLSFLVLLLLVAASLGDSDRWQVILRRGAFWIGPATYVPGIVGALLAGALLTSIDRLLFALVLVFGLIVVQRTPSRHLAGIAAGAGFLLSVALLAGGLDPVYVDDRFAGGVLAFTHPNLIGIFAATLALAWLFLPAGRGLRWVVVPILLVVLLLTDSRTAMGAFLVGIPLGLASWRARTLLLAVAAGLALFGAAQSFLTPRSPDSQYSDVLTGRTKIWEQGLREWRSSGVIGRLLGPASDTFGALTLDDGRTFVPHNVFIGVLVRGGLIGVFALVAGLVMLAAHTRLLLAMPRDGVARAALVLIGAGLATAITEDWLTGDLVWWWIAVSESVLIAGLAQPNPQPPVLRSRRPALRAEPVTAA